MDQELLARTTLRKVAWKLIPFLCVLYIFNIIDRANVGFARLSMQDDLGMSQAMFDFGYGLFYIGYLLFEVPSNLLLRRVGARVWIARIMITWGVISCATMFVTDATGFYVIRVLLGVAEAGFFPGIILYLSYWFPDRQRAKMTAFFMMAIALASILGNPVSGLIMQHLDGASGLKDWQWLFLLEGIPSVILGVLVFFVLTDRPEQAAWLSTEERQWLVGRMRQEEAERKEQHGADHLGALLNRRVWLLIAIYFTVAVTSNAAGAYFPQLIKEHFTGWSTSQIGLLSALPHIFAATGMVLFSTSSDRTGERRGHVAVAALLAAMGWAIAAMAPSPAVALAGLCLAQMGMMSMLPVFWSLPTAFLSGAAAAGGIALINSVANIGGFVGPMILGQFGLWAMSSTLVVGAMLVMCVRRDRPSETPAGQAVSVALID
jgi:ACS family tartrate transporter-like MFS transporter